MWNEERRPLNTALPKAKAETRSILKPFDVKDGRTMKPKPRKVAKLLLASAYLLFVCACVIALIVDTAHGGEGPFYSASAFLVWLPVFIITLPWSFVATAILFIVASSTLGFFGHHIVGNLYLESLLMLLAYIGGAVINVWVVGRWLRRRRQRREPSLTLNAMPPPVANTVIAY